MSYLPDSFTMLQIAMAPGCAATWLSQSHSVITIMILSVQTVWTPEFCWAWPKERQRQSIEMTWLPAAGRLHGDHGMETVTVRSLLRTSHSQLVMSDHTAAVLCDT